MNNFIINSPQNIQATEKSAAAKTAVAAAAPTPLDMINRALPVQGRLIIMHL